MIQVTAGLIRKGPLVFIARRRAGSSGGGKWEFPGGKVEAGETPAAGLRRELAEELAVEVRVGRCLGASEHTNERGTIQLLLYEAEILAGDIRLLDHDVCAWVPVPELPQYDFAPADLPFVERLVAGCSGEPGRPGESGECTLEVLRAEAERKRPRLRRARS